MPSRPAVVRVADMKRILQGAIASGLQVTRVEVSPDGTVIVYTPSAALQDTPSPLEQWRREHGQG